MDLSRNRSPLDAHTTEPHNPNWRCVNNHTVAVQRSDDLHPQSALLWRFMLCFSIVFWAGVGLLAFG